LKKSKIILAVLILSMMALIFSGCGGVSGPKTAKLNISIEPNPVPYSSEQGLWWYTMNISESNGVGVSITSLTFNYYYQEDQFIGTQVLVASEFFEWFETDYVPAFSAIQNGIDSPSKDTSEYHDIVIVAGIDDNGNSVEATVRIDYLPK